MSDWTIAAVELTKRGLRVDFTDGAETYVGYFTLFGTMQNELGNMGPPPRRDTALDGSDAPLTDKVRGVLP